MNTSISSSRLAALIQQLCNSNSLTASVIAAMLRSSGVSEADVQPYVRYSEDNYTRNLVFGNEEFQALVLCWSPSQGSPVHSHGKSSCGVRILSGTATERSYENMQSSEPYRTESLQAGDVTFSDSPFVHSIINEGCEPLITLHVYAPPLISMPAN